MSIFDFSARGFKHSLFRSGSLLVLLLVALPIALVVLHSRLETNAFLQRSTVVPPAAASIPATPRHNLTEEVGHFRPNQNITDALLAHGVPSDEIRRMVDDARPVYNLARVAAGRSYCLVFDAGRELRGLRYAVDDERYLTVYHRRDDYVAVMKDFPYESRVESVAGRIDGSLFQAVTDSGETELLAVEIARIFSYDVDFYTDIQPGDSFRILVQKKYLSGRFVKYAANPILAATLVTGGRQHTGYRYQTEGGPVDYYAADGQSLRKSFLKSPLQFARISSRFSHARYHPILKTVRPHLGVDYAAPVGTPVVAVGAATVAAAGFHGASGRLVRLRHAEDLETHYLHLSRIAVQPGARVAQGEVIGYVGASGLATGPHLDFRVARNGRFINPTTVIFPPAPPVPAAELARFAAVCGDLESRLRETTSLARATP